MDYPIEYLESRIAPATIVTATSGNELLTFDSETPGTVETIAITGFVGTAGETLVGIDFRPATGALYGFTVNNASQGQLYRIDPLTGEATPVGTAITDMNLTLPTTAGYGFDFNPTVDRIRIVNSVGENFRLNPNNGAIAGVDTDLTAGAIVHGSAYDRNFAGSASTTLFGIDVNTDQLVLQGSVNGTPNSPNGGAITNVGGLGVNAVSGSFDIANGTGIGFAVLQVGTTTGLYTINLTTGAATSVGDVGTGTSTVVGMAVATEQIEIVNSKTARYTDVDGDVVTIKITKGDLTSGLFELGAGPNGGAYLRLLNLSDSSFSGTNLTITAKPGPDGGNKLASVSYINATGVDLGVVKISGDLQQIDAGDASGGVAVKSLSVDSFGRVIATNPATDAISTIEGSINKLTTKKDFSGQLVVSDSTEGALGRVGSMVVGGSFVGGATAGSGSVTAEQIGSIRIAHDLTGGAADATGVIAGGDSIDSISIGGSLLGGDGLQSGQITANEFGKVTIKGSIVGGQNQFSGRISAGNIDSISIGQSLIGGAANFAGAVSAEGSIGKISIKGSIIGGQAESTAIVSANEIRQLTVGRDVFGTSNSTAQIFANDMGTVKIGGDLTGNGNSSAQISSEAGIDSVSIGGNVSGLGFSSATISATTIGTVNVGGSLSGSNEDAGAILGTSVDRVTIGGNLVGVGSGSGAVNFSGAVGTVLVRGSIQGGFVFGNASLESVTVNGDVSSVAESAISSEGELGTVVVKGSLHSGFGSGGIFGSSIESVTVGGDIKSTFISSNEDGDIGSIKIQGSLVESTIFGGDIGSINIGHDIIGSLGEGGAVFANGEVDSIVVKGSINSGIGGSGIFAGILGSVKVNGDITGTSTNRINITAIGTQATSGTVDLAIASVTVGGRVENADILAGFSSPTAPENADAQIGKVTVGGDWISSNLVAGIAPTNAVFGDGDDIRIAEVGQVDTIVASIASITIKGAVIGTFGGVDSFAFTAEEIQAASISGKKVNLEDGLGNDNPTGLDPLYVFGNTQDVRIREINVV
jgi:hypothetical protein